MQCAGRPDYTPAQLVPYFRAFANVIHDEDVAAAEEAVIAHPVLLEAFNLLNSEDEAILDAAVSAILAAIDLCSAAGTMVEGYERLCMYLAEGVRFHCFPATAYLHAYFDHNSIAVAASHVPLNILQFFSHSLDASSACLVLSQQCCLCWLRAECRQTLRLVRGTVCKLCSSQYSVETLI